MGIFDRIRGKKILTDNQPAPEVEAEKETKKKPAKEAAAEDEPVIGGTKADATSGNAQSYRWLKRPHVSEKAAILTEQNAYVFDVPVSAEKIVVKKAVEALYKVKVIKVRTLRGPGKLMRRGRKYGRRNAWKKAIVTLKPGQKIELYEGV
jgi:large subunit ribosomal protein L23